MKGFSFYEQSQSLKNFLNHPRSSRFTSWHTSLPIFPQMWDYLEDHPRTCKWWSDQPPMFFSHLYRYIIWKGVPQPTPQPTPSLGDNHGFFTTGYQVMGRSSKYPVPKPSTSWSYAVVLVLQLSPFEASRSSEKQKNSEIIWTPRGAGGFLARKWPALLGNHFGGQWWP